MRLKDLKAGDFFKLSSTSKTVYVMGLLRGWKYIKDFDRTTKKYTVTNFNDNNDDRQFSGDREVFVDFIF